MYSQGQEDELLLRLIEMIELPSTRFAVEFGVGDGTECNTRLLRERGYSVVMMDAAHSCPGVNQEWITAENINGLFEKYSVPEDFDVLSIDIDGNDYWIWRAIDRRYRPRLVVIEYNAALGPLDSVTVPYDPLRTWDGTDYFGASLQALVSEARRKGYRLLCCEARGVNAFFIRSDVPNSLPDTSLSMTALWMPPNYPRFPKSNKPMIEVP